MARAEVVAWGITYFIGGLVFAGLDKTWIVGGVFLSTALINPWLTKISARAICFLLFACGYIYFLGYISLKEASVRFPPTSDVKGVIVTVPERRPGGTSFDLQIYGTGRGKFQAYASEDTTLRYGDNISATGKIYEGNDRLDPYRIYLKDLRIESRGSGNWIVHTLISIKERCLQNLAYSLKGDRLAFLEGILLGHKNDFPDNLREDLKKSGTTHLVALSGYNVSLIVGALSIFFLGLLGRRGNLLLTSAIIGLFVIMVGAEPSILRAAIMGILMLFAKEFGRIPNLMIIMLWTALLMVLSAPDIIFTAGFLLSFASMLGMGYVSPALARTFNIEMTSGSLKEMLALTLGAQIGAMPVLVLLFDEISLAGILANMVILPLMPIIMFAGFTVLGLGFFGPLASIAPSVALEILLAFILGVIRFFAQMDMMISVENHNFIYIYITFLTIFMLWARAKQNA